MNSTCYLNKEYLYKDYDKKLDFEGVEGERLAHRLSKIAEIGLTKEGGANRPGYSEEEREAKNIVRKWMEGLGVTVQEDAAGNIIGKFLGKRSKLPSIMTGSHIDTVPNGGHFDGVLGVLTALEVIESWKKQNYIPDRSIELVIFSDEEGTRFNTGFTGSQAMMGDLNIKEISNLRDKTGLTFKEVIKKNNLSISKFNNAERNKSEIAAFVELHIEQGRQLEKFKQPVGIVSGISGQNIIEFSFFGIAEHAGNTPMDDRQDALVAASEFVQAVEKLPRQVSNSAVATIGQLRPYPNGVNVIPGRVDLSVDIRDIKKTNINELTNLILNKANNISHERNIVVKWEETLNVNPVSIEKEIQEIQALSLQKHQIKPFHIPSGAGHDAMSLGKYLPVSMFFVRCRDGISHNPREWTNLNDCIYGVHILKDFLERFPTRI